MFGIGMPEMVLILVVALMVFGPRRLPELAESIGRAVARLRAATGAVQSQVEREMRSVRDVATAAPEPDKPPAPEPDQPAEAPDPNRDHPTP